MNNTSVWQKAAMPVFLMIIFVIAIFGVVNLNKSLKNPPSLTISGSKEVETSSDKVTISGTTDQKAKVDVNGKKVTVGKDGKFSYEVPVKEGVQTIKVVATRLYSTRTEEVKVTRTDAAKVNTDPVVTPAPSVPTAEKTTPLTTPVVAPTTSSDLSASGPVESVSGALGLTTIAFSLYFYRKSRRLARLTALGRI